MIDEQLLQLYKYTDARQTVCLSVCLRQIEEYHALNLKINSILNAIVFLYRRHHSYETTCQTQCPLMK